MHYACIHKWSNWKPYLLYCILALQCASTEGLLVTYSCVTCGARMKVGSRELLFKANILDD